MIKHHTCRNAEYNWIMPTNTHKEQIIVPLKENVQNSPDLVLMKTIFQKMLKLI